MGISPLGRPFLVPRLAKFREYSVAALGVDKGDPGAMGAITGNGVDHPGPFSLEVGDGRLDLLCFVGHMVNAGAVLLKKFRHRAIIGCRFQEFDLGIADLEHGNLHLLLGNLLDPHERHTELVTVEGNGFVKGFHGNPDMIDFSKQGDPL